MMAEAQDLMEKLINLDYSVEDWVIYHYKTINQSKMINKLIHPTNQLFLTLTH